MRTTCFLAIIACVRSISFLWIQAAFSSEITKLSGKIVVFFNEQAFEHFLNEF